MNIDLNNLYKMLTLRCADDSQIETRHIAMAIKELTHPIFPISMSSI